MRRLLVYEIVNSRVYPARGSRGPRRKLGRSHKSHGPVRPSSVQFQIMQHENGGAVYRAEGEGIAVTFLARREAGR